MLMIPATMSASMAFMLPVATPPNAIIFGTGLVSVRQMALAGLLLNLLGAVVNALWFGLFFSTPIFLVKY
jgi:sodium-dependent dicarboxylate transporter 2/3/5